MKSSSERLRDYLARHPDTRPVLLSDAMYHAQVRYTCDLLDVVDEVADPETAGKITDAIGERLAGPAVAEANERAVQAMKNYEALSGTARAPRA
jgi:hypothetical protein